MWNIFKDKQQKWTSGLRPTFEKVIILKERLT